MLMKGKFMTAIVFQINIFTNVGAIPRASPYASEFIFLWINCLSDTKSS